MVGLVVSLTVIGLLAGLITLATIPGTQTMSVFMTILLGTLGSFVGGFLGFSLFQHDPLDGFFQPAGIAGAVIGAIVMLAIYRFVARADGAPRRTTAR